MEEKNQNQPQEAQETKQPKKGIKRTKIGRAHV